MPAVIQNPITSAVQKFREEDLFDDVESDDDEDELLDSSNNFVKNKRKEDEETSSDAINLNWCRGCGNHNASKPDPSLAETVGNLIQVSLNETIRH